jgi:hypothetical protein
MKLRYILRIAIGIPLGLLLAWAVAQLVQFITTT